MIIYLVDSFSSGDKAFTDRQLAQHECDSYNRINTTEYYIIKPIELTTDSFMESVLTKDSK